MVCACDVCVRCVHACVRACRYVVDGVVKVLQIAEAEDDPAGDARPEVSCIENMIKLIGELA